MSTTEDPTVGAWSFLREPGKVAKELLQQAEAAHLSGGYLAKARQRAQTLGIDMDVVLEEDAIRVQQYPTAQCLTPDEVEHCWTEEEPIDPERVQHAQQCPFCMKVLKAAQPTPERFERFLDELGSISNRAAVRRRSRSSPM